MNISARNFIASQALYGLMISDPYLSHEKQVVSAYRIADMMVKQSRRGKHAKSKNKTNNKHNKTHE